MKYIELVLGTCELSKEMSIRYEKQDLFAHLDTISPVF